MYRLAFGTGIALVLIALLAALLGFNEVAGLSRDGVRIFLYVCLALAALAFVGAVFARRRQRLREQSFRE